MPRAVWSGAISFGLVNIPVKLFNAVSRKNVAFNQVDARTGSRVKMQRVASADGHEVPYEDIVKGFEIGPDRYVIIEPGDLEALDPEASRTIDIEEFVDLVDIDPVFYDSAYQVAPAKGAAKPYALLEQAMEQEGKVAIARFVMRTKQYLCALRPKDGRLVMSTMVYADEVIDPAEIDDLRAVDGIDVTERELAMARQLVTSLSAPFEPARHRDEYRERVLDLIERKAAGEEIVLEPAAAESSKVVDLMAALEASVAEARAARGRHPTARADDGAEAGDGDAEADAAPAREPRAKRARKSA